MVFGCIANSVLLVSLLERLAHTNHATAVLTAMRRITMETKMSLKTRSHKNLSCQYMSLLPTSSALTPPALSYITPAQSGIQTITTTSQTQSISTIGTVSTAVVLVNYLGSSAAQFVSTITPGTNNTTILLGAAAVAGDKVNWYIARNA